MSQDFKTVIVTKALLEEALEDNRYWKNTHIPFSKSKARWWLQNPRANSNDICAVLGYDGETLVTMVYMIPDWLNTNNEFQKVHWCRRWWVHPKYKDTILATYTLNEAVTQANNQIVIKFLGRDVEAFYKKQPYHNFYSRTRFIVLYNVDAGILVNKIKFLKPISSLLKPMDSLSLFMVNKGNKRKAQKVLHEVHYEYVNTIDNAIWNFIEAHCKNDFILKTKAYINWQLSSSQYTTAPIFEKYPFRDHVASISNKIHPITFSILKNNTIIGFISVLVRGKEFDVKYFICEEKYFEICAAALIDNFVQAKTNTLLTENEVLGEYLAKHYYKVFVNRRQLEALAHKQINCDFKNKKVLDRDGHFA